MGQIQGYKDNYWGQIQGYKDNNYGANLRI